MPLLLRVLFVCLCFVSPLLGLAQCNPWATLISGNQFTGARSVVQEASGNLYLAGHFLQNVVIGSDTLTVSHPEPGIFLSKLSPEGIPIWNRHLPGKGFGFEPVLAQQGNFLYLALGFTDTLRLDSMEFISPANESATVIARLDTSGNTVWAEMLVGEVVTLDATSDATGDLILCGYFDTMAEFPDSTVLATTGLAAFLCRLDRFGNLRWAIADTGQGLLSRMRALAVNEQGEIYGAGVFINRIEFNNLVGFGQVAGLPNPFLAKFAADGTPIWLQAGMNGGTTAEVFDLAIGAGGNVYTAGWQFGILAWDTVLIDGAQGTALLGKWLPNGDPQWFRQAGKPNSMDARYVHRVVEFGPDGSVWVLSALGDSTVIDGQLFSSVGDQELKVLRYSAWDGLLQSVDDFPAVGNSGARKLIFDADGSALVLGYFSAPTYQFEGSTLTNYGQDTSGSDVFLARLCGTPDFVGQAEASPKEICVRVGPNPVPDAVVLEFNAPFRGEVRLLDLRGIPLRQSSLSARAITALRLDLRDLPAGIYLLELREGSRRTIKRLSKF
ncbi:MAG: hypothetical protein AAF998_10240 [Bacteroidota bacterium]